MSASGVLFSNSEMARGPTLGRPAHRIVLNAASWLPLRESEGGFSILAASDARSSRCASAPHPALFPLPGPPV